MGAKQFSHGCTERETAILDRAEAGQSHASIAAELGVTPGYVLQVVRYYNSGLDSDRRWRLAAEMSNRAYLKAIAATGRRFA